MPLLNYYWTVSVGQRGQIESTKEMGVKIHFFLHKINESENILLFYGFFLSIFFF